jgi:hypothetical protein
MALLYQRGATDISSCCTRSIKVLTFCVGLPQKTRQCLGSTYPGSIEGSHSLVRTGSMLTPANVLSNSLAFC